jgi:hypothetical protein
MISDTIYIIILYTDDIKLRTLNNDFKTKYDVQYHSLISNIKTHYSECATLNKQFNTIINFALKDKRFTSSILDCIMEEFNILENKIDSYKCQVNDLLLNFKNELPDLFKHSKYYDVTEYINSLKIMDYEYYDTSSHQYEDTYDLDMKYSLSINTLDGIIKCVIKVYGELNRKYWCDIKVGDLQMDLRGYECKTITLNKSYEENIKLLIILHVVSYITCPEDMSYQIMTFWLGNYVKIACGGKEYQINYYESIIKKLNEEHDNTLINES